ncbi:MAG: Flp family type IVb pilin [Anaerolineae bacterium]|nr:Flp family type IVb pilin [Anaerolineae bacterium]
MWISYVKAWIEEQKGQDLAEYALLLGLIAVVVIAIVAALGDQISWVFNEISATLAEHGIGG